MIQADFFILTALDVETQALKRHLEDVNWIQGTPYAHGKVAAREGPNRYIVVFAQCDDTGVNPPSALVKRAVEDYNPRYVLLIGIAAGFPENGVQLGDVMLPEWISPYAKAKLTPGKIEHRGRPLPVTASTLLSLARRMAEHEQYTWYRAMCETRPNNRVRDYPMVHAKSNSVLGSGPRVIADALAEERKWLIDTYKELSIGLEVEATDTALECRECETNFLVIKAAQDDATENKDAKDSKDLWRAYAADAAATFAVTLIACVPLALTSKRLEIDPIIEAEHILSFDLGILENEISRRVTVINRRRINLPPKAAVVEREKELGIILEALWKKEPCAIVGPGGVGKTVIASEAGYRALDSQSIESVIWVTIERGLLTKEVLLRRLRNALRIDPTYLDEQNLTTRICQELSQHKSLLIIDNIELEYESSSPGTILLQKLAQASKLIITSRQLPISPPMWKVIEITPFSIEQTQTLIYELIPDLGTEQNNLVQIIHRLSQGFPLIIELLVAKFSQIISKEEIIDSTKLLNPEDTITDVLEHLSEKASGLLHSIATFDTPPSLGAAKFVAGMTAIDINTAIKELSQKALLKERKGNMRDVLRIHPYIRTYVREQMYLNKTLESNTYSRLLRYLKHLLSDVDERDTVFYKRIDEEFDNFIGLLQWSKQRDQCEIVLDIRGLLSRYLFLRGFWQERLECGEVALGAARKIKDELSEAWILLDDLGWTLVEIGEYDKTEIYIREAKRIFNRNGNAYGESKALRHLEAIEYFRGNIDDAHKLALETLNKAEQIDSEELRIEMIAATQYVIADRYLAQNEFYQAKDGYLQSYNLYSRIGDVLRRVKIYSRYADVLRALGEFDSAQRVYEIGIVRSLEVDRLDEIGYNLRGLAYIQIGKGLLHRAKQYATWALQVFQFLEKVNICSELQNFLGDARFRDQRNTLVS